MGIVSISRKLLLSSLGGANQRTLSKNMFPYPCLYIEEQTKNWYRFGHRHAIVSQHVGVEKRLLLSQLMKQMLKKELSMHFHFNWIHLYYII